MATQQRTRNIDPQLLAGLKNGDESAVEQLYAEFGGTVFGFLMRALRDRGAAEDVQQQVFLEVWKRGPSYDPARAGLLTWIMQIARSRAIDFQRKRIPDPVDIDETSPTDATTADEFTDAMHDQWHIAHLLKQLPHEESQLLRARFYDGKSQSEIAAETGIALGTVKMRMIQGLKRLRELIESDQSLERPM
jgi:RNA polymerase sigma-70 factor (ECF subfamily)